MRTLILSTISAFSLIGALLEPTGAAHAVQLAISMPADKSVPESRFGFATLSFEIANTGVPAFKTIIVNSISEYVDPYQGDIAGEVLSTDFTTDCSTALFVGTSCKVSAVYHVLDADPFDADATVDSATWFAGITVDWSFSGEPDHYFAANNAFVTIHDDPVPEPAAWLTLMLGAAGIGAALRGRRTVIAR